MTAVATDLSPISQPLGHRGHAAGWLGSPVKPCGRARVCYCRGGLRGDAGGDNALSPRPHCCRCAAPRARAPSLLHVGQPARLQYHARTHPAGCAVHRGAFGLPPPSRGPCAGPASASTPPPPCLASSGHAAGCTRISSRSRAVPDSRRRRRELAEAVAMASSEPSAGVLIKRSGPHQSSAMRDARCR